MSGSRREETGGATDGLEWFGVQCLRPTLTPCTSHFLLYSFPLEMLRSIFVLLFDRSGEPLRPRSKVL